jgi:hypothetical protein
MLWKGAISLSDCRFKWLSKHYSSYVDFAGFARQRIASPGGARKGREKMIKDDPFVFGHFVERLHIDATTGRQS